MRRLVLLCGMALLAVCGVGLRAQPRAGGRQGPATREEAEHLLDAWIESVVAYDRLPGLSIAVVHDQDVVYAKGFGYADVERSVRATPATIYSVCSISKTFTAIAVMQLRDEGRLKLDDPVSRLLPWMGVDGVAPELRSITIRELLRHTSGLPCEPDHTVWADPDSLDPSNAALVARAQQLRPSYPPDTRFNYSNLGYALLGQVVATVSGMEYGQYVREKIFEPLGLTSTTLGMPADQGQGKQATGYGRWPRAGSRVVIDDRKMRAMAPARGLSSTVEDLEKFAMWQFRVLDGTDDRVLRRESLTEMQAAQWSDPEWGLGFAIWHVDGGVFVGHQGGCPGYKSQIILSPEEKIAVVVMVNATDAPQFTLAFRAHEILAPSLLSAPLRREAPNEWTGYVGYYTSNQAWSDAEVLEWNGSLAVMWVPTEDPLGSLVELESVGDGLFRQLRPDGEPGKYYAFRGDSVSGIHMKFNSNLLTRTARVR